MAEENNIEIKTEQVEEEIEAEFEEKKKPKNYNLARALLDMTDHSVRFGPMRLGLPPGFKTLLEDIVREWWQSEPKDPVGYIAFYLNDMVEERDKAAEEAAAAKAAALAAENGEELVEA